MSKNIHSPPGHLVCQPKALRKSCGTSANTKSWWRRPGGKSRKTTGLEIFDSKGGKIFGFVRQKSLKIELSRERARRAADQRRAEDDLSSLTSYWTNTVLAGAQFVSTHRINHSILELATVFSWSQMVSIHYMETDSNWFQSIATIFPSTDWQHEWQSKKTQGLWWRGLPPPVRGKVWRLALTNSLNLTTHLYTILR